MTDRRESAFSLDRTASAGAGYPVGWRVRIGDAERERAVSALGEHFAAGRLTADELDERLGLAWSAKTAADLSPLFADLPGAAVVAERDARPVSGRGRPSGRRIGLVLPLLPILAFLVVLTIVTHVPFVLFFFGWWFFIGRFFGGGGGARGRGYAFRQPYARRR